MGWGQANIAQLLAGSPGSPRAWQDQASAHESSSTCPTPWAVGFWSKIIALLEFKNRNTGCMNTENTRNPPVTEALEGRPNHSSTPPKSCSSAGSRSGLHLRPCWPARCYPAAHCRQRAVLGLRSAQGRLGRGVALPGRPLLGRGSG